MIKPAKPNGKKGMDLTNGTKFNISKGETNMTSQMNLLGDDSQLGEQVTDNLGAASATILGATTANGTNITTGDTEKQIGEPESE